MYKKGFTIAELLITLFIIFVILGVSINAMNSHNQKQNELRYQKAMNNIQRIVDDLVNNTFIYPEDNDLPSLSNTSRVFMKGAMFEGNTKFCELFASKMRPDSEINCTEANSTLGGDDQYTFKTNDGITWALPITDFGNRATPQSIFFDVNGSSGNNCFFDADTCPNPDRHEVFVYQDGKMSEYEIQGMQNAEHNQENVNNQGENNIFLDIHINIPDEERREDDHQSSGGGGYWDPDF